MFRPACLPHRLNAADAFMLEEPTWDLLTLVRLRRGFVKKISIVIIISSIVINPVTFIIRLEVSDLTTASPYQFFCHCIPFAVAKPLQAHTLLIDWGQAV